MGCGCNNGRNEERKMSLPPSFMAGARPSAGIDTSVRDGEAIGSYGETAGCSKCYAKHLSKAAIEYSEYLEDSSRYAELSLCMGDMACAEDHASALGREKDRERIHELRNRAWSADRLVRTELQRMAVEATRAAVEDDANERRSIAEREAARRKEFEARAAEARKGATADLKSVPAPSVLDDAKKVASEKKEQK